MIQGYISERYDETDAERARWCLPGEVTDLASLDAWLETLPISQRGATQEELALAMSRSQWSAYSWTQSVPRGDEVSRDGAAVRLSRDLAFLLLGLASTVTKDATLVWRVRPELDVSDGWGRFDLSDDGPDVHPVTRRRGTFSEPVWLISVYARVGIAPVTRMQQAA